MRTIQISTETFAAIWKAQEIGEASEDVILKRLLGVATAVSPTLPERDLKVVLDGFHDPRYDVVIPHGFRIFRTYHGKDYSARAMQGFWILEGANVGYGSLNELSGAIGISHENAWTNWFFHDEKGRRKPLSVLRDPTRIVKRSKVATSRPTGNTVAEAGL
jgi:hypothetical protein